MEREERNNEEEEEKKAKVKPGSFVNTPQTLFAAEHFLQSAEPSLHDSHARWKVRLCVHLLGKYSDVGCVPGELDSNVIAVLQSHVVVYLGGPVFWRMDSLIRCPD